MPADCPRLMFCSQKLNSIFCETAWLQKTIPFANIESKQYTVVPSVVLKFAANSAGLMMMHIQTQKRYPQPILTPDSEFDHGKKMIACDDAITVPLWLHTGSSIAFTPCLHYSSSAGRAPIDLQWFSVPYLSGFQVKRWSWQPIPRCSPRADESAARCSSSRLVRVHRLVPQGWVKCRGHIRD